MRPASVSLIFILIMSSFAVALEIPMAPAPLIFECTTVSDSKPLKKDSQKVQPLPKFTAVSARRGEDGRVTVSIGGKKYFVDEAAFSRDANGSSEETFTIRLEAFNLYLSLSGQPLSRNATLRITEPEKIAGTESSITCH